MILFATPLVLLVLAALAGLLLLSRGRLRDLVLPAIAASLLIVAMAGPELRQAQRRENVYVLLDRSPSVAASATEDEVYDAWTSLRAANPGKRFGAIAFASHAALLDPLRDTPVPSVSLADSGGLGTRTNLAPAVALALAALPNGDANHIVLASDGRITDGLLEAVSAARAANVPISVLPVGRPLADDALLSSLEIPAHVEANRPFQVIVGVESPTPAEAALVLYRDGELISTTIVSLDAKLSRYQIPDTLTTPGSHTYQAAVKRPGDPVLENDSLFAFAHIEAEPPLLVVSSGLPGALSALLAASGKPYVVSPAVPSLEELAGYRQVLLTAVPLSSLGSGDIEALRSFVADLGGGLFVAEGEEELRGARAGGIEALLPVSYTLPQRAEQASLAVVYLLDRSASMLGNAESAAKIDVVKEAAAASIGLLEPDAMVGVIAFDRNFRWLYPLAPVLDGREIYESLRTLEASGGTDIYYPAVAALDALEQISARVKHILILTDGKTVDEVRDWDGLSARLEAQPDVHLSVVAVGPQPNLSLLDRLAEAGRGTVLVAADVSMLPQVSMEATQRLSRSRFVIGDNLVAGELRAGELAAIPAVQGYALTYPRPTTEVLLSAGNDPVVARWRLGLGRAGVLNTDLAGVWSHDWLAWSRASLLFETLLGTVEAETLVTQGLRPSIELGAAGVLARVEAREPDGAFANFLALEATLLPGGALTPFEQTSAGLYEATLPALAEGGYALRVVDRTRNRVAILPFSVPYPAEYRQTGVDDSSLRAIARATGGNLLTSETLPEPSATAASLSFIPIHSQVLLCSLAFFLLELVRRKLPRRRTSRPVPGG